jgi:hypothetical protein
MVVTNCGRSIQPGRDGHHLCVGEMGIPLLPVSKACFPEGLRKSKGSDFHEGFKK